MTAAFQAKKPMKPQPIVSAVISMTRRGRPVTRSMSKPTRIISPWRNVCARPRNAIAAMHQETRSSPAGTLMPSGRPAERIIISTKMTIMNKPAR